MSETWVKSLLKSFCVFLARSSLPSRTWVKKGTRMNTTQNGCKEGPDEDECFCDLFASPDPLLHAQQFLIHAQRLQAPTLESLGI